MGEFKSMQEERLAIVSNTLIICVQQYEIQKKKKSKEDEEVRLLSNIYLNLYCTLLCVSVCMCKTQQDRNKEVDRVFFFYI